MGRGLRCHLASHGLPLAVWLRSPGGEGAPRVGEGVAFGLVPPPPAWATDAPGWLRRPLLSRWGLARTGLLVFQGTSRRHVRLLTGSGLPLCGVFARFWWGGARRG